MYAYLWYGMLCEYVIGIGGQAPRLVNKYFTLQLHTICYCISLYVLGIESATESLLLSISYYCCIAFYVIVASYPTL